MGESVKVREVAESIADLDQSNRALFEEILAVAKEAGIDLEVNFDVEDYKYHITAIQDGDEPKSTNTPAEEALELIRDLSAAPDVSFDGVVVRSKLSSPTSTPTCGSVDCHTVEPAMSMLHNLDAAHSEQCSIGWIVVKNGELRILSADHCGQSYYRVRGTNVGKWTPQSSLLWRLTGSGDGKTDDGQGIDVRIFSMSDSGRGGNSRNEALNAVLKSRTAHTDLITNAISAASEGYVKGSVLCVQGGASLGYNHVPDCGKVTDLGELSSEWWKHGYAKVDALACAGDSGGPIWKPSALHPSWGSNGYSAAGVLSGGEGETDSDDCLKPGGKTMFTDMGLALSNTGSSFYNPAGDDRMRRQAIRLYDIILGRSPDNGAIANWSTFTCNSNSPADMAFVLTVTSPEFKNRFPVSGSDSRWRSRDRAKHLYWGLFDRTPAFSEYSYWGDFIWGSWNSSIQDRNARSDYVAWQFIVNPNWGFQARYSSWGPNGSPPWCSWGA